MPPVVSALKYSTKQVSVDGWERLVSNIFTDFIRIYAQPGHHIDQVEAQWIASILLSTSGSYWVPVCIRCGPEGRYADIQYGSGKRGESPDIDDLCEDYIGSWRYSAIWGRHFDCGSEDLIWQDHVNDGPYRFCRYGFDEVRVFTLGDRPAVEAPWQRHRDGYWRLPVAGSYRNGNDRADMRIGPGATSSTKLPPPEDGSLPTPTTPNACGEALTGLDPPCLAALTACEPAATSVELVEYRWRGRLVHRVSFQPEERYLDPVPGVAAPVRRRLGQLSRSGISPFYRCDRPACP
jgi:hypothetical protein